MWKIGGRILHKLASYTCSVVSILLYTLYVYIYTYIMYGYNNVYCCTVVPHLTLLLLFLLPYIIVFDRPNSKYYRPSI